MSKFIIECPNCGKYAEAKTGVFARKKIECDCGHTIHIKTDRLVTRTCPHCGNLFVYDQADGTKVRCPVCRHKVVTTADDTKLVEFSCEQCGVRLSTTKGASTYTCPICDYENNVEERLVKEKIQRDGLASVIKFEGDNETLVWKHPIEDFNYGSQLIVHESQDAIFFKDGQALDLFGAGRYTLETQQLPVLEKLYKLATDNEGTFHSEVYFVNLTTQMGIKWGTDTKVRLFDPASGLHLELGASGEFSIRVINSRKLLLKVVGTEKGLDQGQLMGSGTSKGLFRTLVMTQVKSYLAQTIREKAISVLEIDEHLMELSDALRVRINAVLEDYGLTMPEFFVGRVVTPDEDPNFRRMKEQYAEQYLNVRQEQIRKSEAEAAAQRKTVEAQTAAQMKIISAQGDAEALRIQKQAEADAYRMRAEAEALEMQMKGYNQRDVIQADVQKAYAESLGQIGSNGGSSGGGMLGDIAGLGVTLGAVGSVMGMTREAMAPMANMGAAFAAAPAATGWDCACGEKNITGNFCGNCGAKKPAPVVADTWDCACGQKGITGNFCSNCGAKKPVVETWDCSCGQTGITGNFCSNCGAKKPAPTWDCGCGQTGIKGNFCPNCGSKRG